MIKKKLKSKIFRIAISLIITVVFVYFLINYINFNRFFAQLITIDYYFLIAAAFCLFVNYIFRALRLELILGVEKHKTKLFAISSIHYLFNRILPARLGEASLPILFKQHLKIDYKKGVSSLFFYRILDFLIMLFLLLISLLFVNIEHFNILIIVVFSTLGIFVFFLSWFLLVNIINFILKFISKIKKQLKIIEKLKIFLEKIKTYKKQKNGLFFSKIFLYTFINWIVIYFYYYFVILSFNVDFGYFQTVFAASFSNFAFIIPNAIGNIGTFEAGWGIGFYLLGMSKDISIPIGLFANLFATIITAVIAGVGYVFLKIKIK